jgi:dipeptidyl aminopeptidase/acylaminoacyl peptidase
MSIMQKIIGSSILLLAFCLDAIAQVPDADIWLLDMKKENDQYAFSNPKNITNRQGYDNQPSFSPDGKMLLYTSIREDNQADIYKYDLAAGTTAQLTKTATSEYSPTVMPGGKSVSVVMVEKDSSQRLWKYPLKGGKPKLVLPRIDSIGYHCWYDKRKVALFMLTRPFTLQMASLASNELVLLGKDIGRSIHRINMNKKSLILYVYSAPHEPSRYIVACDENGKHDYIPAIKTPQGSEDLAVMNGHILLMAQGSKLMKYDLLKDKIWTEIADFSAYGITNVTRLAVSADGTKLAVVSNTQ